MKTFKELLFKLDACWEAKFWADDKTIEEVITDIHRGDWLLWLAFKINIPLKELTLAKALCTKTILHLMRDERSKNAIKVAEDFGNGLAGLEDSFAVGNLSENYLEKQREMAQICKDILGELIINRVNKLLSE